MCKHVVRICMCVCMYMFHYTCAHMHAEITGPCELPLSIIRLLIFFLNNFISCVLNFIFSIGMFALK